MRQKGETKELWSTLVYEKKSSGDLVRLLNLFSVNKLHALNDICQVAKVECPVSLATQPVRLSAFQFVQSTPSLA